MLEVPLLGWGWSGPVVWWNPVGGFRHAFSREVRPRPQQQRDTLCGQRVTLIDPSEVDWLVPTCDICMSTAIEHGREQEQREQETSRKLRERFGRDRFGRDGGSL
ncbi:hypothetical protein CDG81_00595 [Actinopolyspora erythraea]|uniref:Zinc-finger domain-containing protein n=1 Tax=Actinopolyspora erythraea TaxID=414996 RepID=A0A223RXS9_9ACTN|nr:hypothetical protein CDG81_00595 [Actinopolyspora erythraea]